MTATAAGPAPSTGSAPAHHGEILQGAFRDHEGTPRRALVTLPCPERGSRATFYPDAARTEILCLPGMSKAQRAAAISMEEFASAHSPMTGGRIEVSSTVPRGIGMGSSTADVTSAIRAIAAYHGLTPSPADIGRIAVRAETASDPIMIDDAAVLFAQREGVVLETLGLQLPWLTVVGCVTAPGVGGIDTLALEPAAYTAADVETFTVLLSELRSAVASGDAAGVGRVATASALINQRFLPNPALEFLLDACGSSGGCGVQVAHSGTVAGVIFDPRRPGTEARAERCADRLEKAGLTLTSMITVSAPGAPGVLGSQDYPFGIGVGSPI
ncbi:MAG: GHMP kinase [Nocardiopsaceae bacterium]|nr:GHMP kinase [Nocardiopsaceae bacterium]